MEIKINKAFAQLTDVEALTDHQKIFLATVSEIYKVVPTDHYIFFNQHDLEVLTNLKRFDPSKSWSRNNHPWVFDCFDMQFHDFQNFGVKPKKLGVRKGFETAGKPTHSVEITDEDAQRLWWYLLGVFGSRELISDFKFRTRVPNHSYTLCRSYIGELNHRLVKRDYDADGSWTVGR